MKLSQQEKEIEEEERRLRELEEQESRYK